MYMPVRGILCGVLLGTVVSLSAHAATKSSTVETWNTYRSGIEFALACEKVFLAEKLAKLDTDPALKGNATEQAHKSHCEARATALKELTLPTTGINDQMCYSRLAGSINEYLNQNGYTSSDKLEDAFSSSIGSYLLGRLGTHLARLSTSNPYQITAALVIKNRLATLRSENRFRSPAVEFGRNDGIQKAARSDALLKYWISLGSESTNAATDSIGNNINDILHELSPSN